MGGLRVFVVAVSAALLVGIAGCGDDEGDDGGAVTEGPDVEAVTAVANEFFTDGLTKGDLGACDLLTPEAEDAFANVYSTEKSFGAKGGTCIAGIAFLANQGNPSGTLFDIDTVTVEGDTATITFASPGNTNVAEATRSGDEWLISKTGLEG